MYLFLSKRINVAIPEEKTRGEFLEFDQIYGKNTRNTPHIYIQSANLFFRFTLEYGKCGGHAILLNGAFPFAYGRQTIDSRTDLEMPHIQTIIDLGPPLDGSNIAGIHIMYIYIYID